MLDRTSEQDALAAAVRSLTERTWPLDAVTRAALADELPDDGALWASLCEMGLPGILVAADRGGSGGTFTDLAVCSEELGRALAPDTLATSAVAASVLSSVGRAGDHSRARTALVVTPAVAARPSPGQLRLRARAEAVVEAGTADLLLVVAGGPRASAICLLPASASRAELAPMYDPTRRFYDVDLDVEVPGDAVVAVDSAAERLAEELDRRMTVARAAAAIGGARRVLELGVAHVSARHQFGKPLGSFQAIKHLLAETFVAVETAASAVMYAAEAVDARPDDLDLAVHAGAALAAEAFVAAAQAAVQVHGAIGFTAETPVHLFLKRAVVASRLPASPAWHRSRVASLLLGLDHVGGGR